LHKLHLPVSTFGCLCVADDPRSITDCMLQAQKEAEEEDKEMKGVLTDTHIMMGTRDLFGGE